MHLKIVKAQLKIVVRNRFEFNLVKQRYLVFWICILRNGDCAIGKCC